MHSSFSSFLTPAPSSSVRLKSSCFTDTISGVCSVHWSAEPSDSMELSSVVQRQGGLFFWILSINRKELHIVAPDAPSPARGEMSEDQRTKRRRESAVCVRSPECWPVYEKEEKPPGQQGGAGSNTAGREDRGRALMRANEQHLGKLYKKGASPGHRARSPRSPRSPRSGAAA